MWRGRPLSLRYGDNVRKDHNRIFLHKQTVMAAKRTLRTRKKACVGRPSFLWKNSGLSFNEIDGMVGAGRNADAVHVAFVFIDHCNAIDDANGIHRAGPDAFSGGAAFLGVDHEFHILTILPRNMVGRLRVAGL
jgi:hypothetical protein